MVLGIAGGAGQASPRRPCPWHCQAYTTIIRGVPDLVLMLLIFFGGQMLVNQLALAVGYEDYIDINPFIAGVLTIGLHLRRLHGRDLPRRHPGGAAGPARGRPRLRHAPGAGIPRILLPQMVRHALPGFGNNWLVLLKTTALLSVIGLDDMVRKARLAAGATREPFTF